MRRALIRKELIQCGVLCAVATLAYIAFAWWYSTIGVHQRAIPFTSGASVPVFGHVAGMDPVVGNFSIIGGVLAAAMGLVQSAWESIGGTWHFLLHRPLSRKSVLNVKLLTGCFLLLLCTVVPGLLYGVWASLPGTHASPFEWSMTEKFWQQWLTLPVIYFAAFQSGLSDARWYGVRLFPLLTAAVLCIALSCLPFWWWTGFPVLVVVVVSQVVTLFHTMRTRDFS